jgi:myo-inositol-1(or 4)-monophosphatase
VTDPIAEPSPAEPSPGEPSPGERAELMALAADLAVRAGTLAADGRRRGLAAIATKSTSTDMVTEFDRAAEALIVEGLLAARPDDGLLGEEGSTRTGSTGVRWLIDPIDGTTNFLYRLAGWAVSIAATTAEGSCAGAVYVPATGELYTAAKGLGAWLDGEPITASEQDRLDHTLVATGFSYIPERRAEQAARLGWLLPLVRDIRRFGAAAADICYVAGGKVDAYFEEHLNPWDVAAGEVIAREAGCRVSAIDGTAAHPGSMLVTAPGIHDELLALLAGGPTGVRRG